MIMQNPIPVPENLSNIIMSLLIASTSCMFVSLSSYEYITFSENNNNIGYGIFEGKNGGTGCLGQCKLELPEDNESCPINDNVCIVYKLLPFLSSFFTIICICLLTFTFELPIIRFKKEISTLCIMSLAFFFGLSSLLVNILTPVTDDNDTLWDIVFFRDGFKWGEGFHLMLSSVVLIFTAIILYIVKNKEFFKTNLFIYC